MVSEYLIVYVTVPTVDEGGKIAQILVSQKLAASVNILPGIRSVYSWEGETCEDDEILLIIKTRAQLFDALSAAVGKFHSYDLPEVIGVPLTAGIPGYLDWIASVT